MEYLSLEEEWEAQLADGSVYPMQVPGSLDESRIGGKDMGANQWHPDADLGNAENSFDPDAPIATRYTRKHTYEGEAKTCISGSRTGALPGTGDRWERDSGLCGAIYQYTTYF